MLCIICSNSSHCFKLNASGWAYATQKLYFDPVGIKADVPFSWDEVTVADIKNRNPSLKDLTFMLPADANRPFPVIGAGLVGPNEGAGYAFQDRNMTFLEMTPLYVGEELLQFRCACILLCCHDDSFVGGHNTACAHGARVLSQVK